MKNNSPIEEWRNVIFNGIDYKGKYLVSNLGKLKSIRHTKKGIKENIIGLHINDVGYHEACLYNDKTRKKVGVHQLVACAFIRVSNTGDVVHHKKGKLDNRAKNLDVITFRENCSIERTVKSGTPLGACKIKGKELWQSSVTRHNSPMYFGQYGSPVVSNNVYQIALTLILDDYDIPRSEIVKYINQYRKTIGMSLLIYNGD